VTNWRMGGPAGSPAAVRETPWRSSEALKKELAAIPDDGEVVAEVIELAPQYVGLVIGKAGSTIKRMKEEAGCERLEVDQSNPAGEKKLIVKGTKRQLGMIKRQVKDLIASAKKGTAAPTDRAADPPWLRGRKDREDQPPPAAKPDSLRPAWMASKGKRTEAPVKKEEPEEKKRTATTVNRFGALLGDDDDDDDDQD